MEELPPELVLPDSSSASDSSLDTTSWLGRESLQHRRCIRVLLRFCSQLAERVSYLEEAAFLRAVFTAWREVPHS